jgi:hypothetical protein
MSVKYEDKCNNIYIVYIKCVNDFDSIGQIAIKIIDTTDDKYKTD